jgi:rare lipoprotein A
MTIYAFILFFACSSFGWEEPITLKGGATFYSDSFQGKRTASGEPYDRQKLTAAHSTLPFDTFLRVTNTRNGLSVTVRINDRMKANSRTIIDLSREAAARIHLVDEGRGMVLVEEVEEDAPCEPLLPLRKGDVFSGR